MHPRSAIDKGKIAARLHTRTIGRQLRIMETVSSTNDIAREMAKAGAPEGLTVIAAEQTAGRGRHGSSWFSPPGQGLLFSVLLRPTFTAEKAGLLPIAAAVAVAESVERCLKLSPKVKWPNDLLIEGRKFCGILTEAESIGGAYEFVILGIGINALHLPEALPEAVRIHATSLSEHVNFPIDRAALMVSALEALEKWVKSLQRKRSFPLLREWKKRCAHIGRWVEIVGPAPSHRGICEDIDSDGGLMVRTADGKLHKIFSGECRISYTENMCSGSKEEV